MKQSFVLVLVVLITLVIIPLVFASKPVSQGNVVLSGNKLYVNGEEFKIKGVAYQPTPIGLGPGYNFYNQPGIYNRDFSLLRNMSANTIRTWAQIQDGTFLNAAYNNGNKPVYVVMGFWVNCSENYNSSSIRQKYINDFGNYVAAYKNYSAVLMWALGNENNLDYCTITSLVDDLNSMYNEMAKKAYEIEGPNYHPVAIINGDVIYLGDAAKNSNDAFLNYTDVWGMNTYPGSSLTAKINEYSGLSSKPLFISEYGTDALDNSTLTEDEEMQADWDVALWRGIANSSIALGGTIMEYSDEWWKYSDGTWGVHDTGGYDPSWNPSSHPDKYVNEEYWGLVRPVDNGANPDIMQPRKVYYGLQGEFLKDGFVKVNGTNFTINGTPFFFAGANNYYLFYKPVSNVQEVFDDAVSLNLSVMRTWAFCDGACSDGNYLSFQPSAGVYNETNLRRLDRVVKEASDRNLKLILPLVNNWKQYGGMCQYVQWCNLTNATKCNAEESWPFGIGQEVHDQFYNNSCTRNLYKNYIAHFLNRTNTLTGVKYKNDPTIFAWELANEPRARNDTTGTVLNDWIGNISAFIKSIDPYHLVTAGGDGGYKDKASIPTWSWWYHGGEGQDFLSNHNWSTIDFATFRFYPEANRFDDVNITLWVQEHVTDSHDILGKPVIMEEFGSQINKIENFTIFYNLLETYGANGDTFWLLADQNATGDDGYFVYCPENATICQIIANHSNFMLNKSRIPPLDYSYNTTGAEYRFYYKNFHFLTIMGNGTFNIRPHPGVDVNGWGSSLYMQPFLPGATLKYTTIQSITPQSDRIKVKASGYVSNGTSTTYGAWSISINFSYYQTKKEIHGNGSYAITLDSTLSVDTGDLNLFKIASNYLDDVPLLTGVTGDTGDMWYANVTLNSTWFIWVPPDNPSYFPQDRTGTISIDAKGQLNNVDTAAQGYARIEPAYKPSLKVNLTSNQSSLSMIFGGIYDTGKSQDFWEDNVGVTPLILKESTLVNYYFDVLFFSEALPNDGNDSDFDGYNSTSDCSDSNVTIYPGAVELCNDVDDDCDGTVDEGCYLYFNISLSQGWNLISSPLIPKNKIMPAPLSSIEGNYSKLFIYNGSRWSMYNPDNVSISNLNEINEKLGFWIKMNNTDTLTIYGSIPPTTNFVLKKGMNLVSYPYNKSQLINETFNTNFTNILTYENNSWKSYSKNKPSYLNTLKNMTPGYGYWVKVSNDVDWSFNGTFN